MDCVFEKEQLALNHYKNTEYFDKSKYINASMTADTLMQIINDVGIDCKKNQTILDFGCGTCETLKFLSETIPNALMVGVDYSSERMAVAEEVIQPVKHRVILVQDDVNNFINSNGIEYDIIFAFEIIEHLVDADNIVSKLKTMLSSNGLLILSLPYQNKPNNIHLTTYKDQADVINRLRVTPLKQFPMRFPNQNIFVYRK